MRTPGLVVAALVLLVSGLWLTRAGRPYHAGIVAIHKLADLVALVLAGLMIYGAHRAGSIDRSGWTVVVTAAVLVAVALATGGALSAAATAPAWVRWCHRITSWSAAVLVTVSAVIAARG